MNRKHVTKSDYYQYGDWVFEINSRPSGCYTPMLKRSIEQLLICLDKWKRVFVLRLDLHNHIKTDDSKTISRYLDDGVKPYLKKHYGIADIGYIWTRETERAKSQHYHLALFLDGDKIQHSRKLNKALKKIWSDNTAGNRTVGHPDKCFHYIEDEESLNGAVYRISYLAKARGKGYRPPQNKDYGASRLKRVIK